MRKTSAEKMADIRVRQKARGRTQITIWVTDEQHELLNRLAKDMSASMSDAAQLLIFKNLRQLKALGVTINVAE